MLQKSSPASSITYILLFWAQHTICIAGGRLDSGAKKGLLDVVNKVMGHALLDFKRAIYAGDDNTAIYVTRWARCGETELKNVV